MVRLWAAAALATLLSFLLAGATHLDPAPLGLSASYESLIGPHRTAAANDVPSADAIARAWGDQAPDAFSTIWRGTIFVPADGAFTFGTRADEEATVYLDGRSILENGGQVNPPATATVRPDRGSHSIVVKYLHNGGAVRFELLWAEGAGKLEPVPSWALRPRRVGDVRIMLSRWLPVALGGAEWLAVALVLAGIAALGWRAVVALWRHLRAVGTPVALAWIVAGSTVLNVIGLWWGLPGGNWAPIELQPVYVLGALATHFLHGWFDAYPPVHFYLLSLALSPIVVLDWLGRIDLHAWIPEMFVIIRLVSVVMAAGTLVAVYLCGTLAFSRKAGLFAAAIFALDAPFLYFAKMGNVDVPYVFWFALSLVFYLLVLRDNRTRDYVGLALAATLSICTKDQAYGLYLLPPLVLLWEKGLNRRLVVAALVSIAAFLLIDGVVFNFSGFEKHVQFITGPGNIEYRIFAPTLAGRVALLRLTTRLTELSWGWPLTLVCAAGVVAALVRRETRRMTVWLVAPVVGYYFGFLNVILYAYDRFTLPICLVLALFGGFALDRLVAPANWRALRLGAIAVAFAYTLLYSATVDVLMVEDSRYAAERWLAAQTITPDDLIGVNVLSNYTPRLDRYKVGSLVTIDDLHMGAPKFFVLNVDYTRGENMSTPVGQVIAGLERHEQGYTLVYRGRTPSPWPWLPGAHRDLVGPRLEPLVFSSLRNINPTIEIFQHDTTIGR